MLKQIDEFVTKFNLDNPIDLDNLDKLFINLCEIFNSNEPNYITTIEFVLADRFDYYPMKRGENIQKICEEREGQNKFRHDLIIRDKKCLISEDNAEICDACHIIPYSESRSYDIANGLLLNKCFHKMFDSYIITIEPTTHLIKFRDDFELMEDFLNYRKYLNIKLKIPLECDKYLQHHYNEFIKHNEK